MTDLRYFIVERVNGKLTHHRQNVPPETARQRHNRERLGVIETSYLLTDDQLPWSLHELVQAAEYGMLTKYSAPTAPPTPPDCWAKLGLDPTATHAPDVIEAAFTDRMKQHTDPSIRMGLKRARGFAMRLLAQ